VLNLIDILKTADEEHKECSAELEELRELKVELEDRVSELSNQLKLKEEWYDLIYYLNACNF
jgi:Tfp pilus assembly protein PilO